MTTTHEEQLKPFSREIVVKVEDRNDFNNSPIHVPERSKNEDAHFFRVLRVGSDVHEVKPGNVIYVRWANTMPPFLWGSDLLSVTREEHVEAVIDG